MNIPITIEDYQPIHQPVIRRVLQQIGWAEQYIDGAEKAAESFSTDRETCRVLVAFCRELGVGFLSVQYYAWNQLAQIHSLAVDPAMRRRGIALDLVGRAEEFARSKQARGIYVDTPTSNSGGRRFYETAGYQFGYIMPRYYEDGLDGVTYQKFFTPPRE